MCVWGGGGGVEGGAGGRMQGPHDTHSAFLIF